MSYPFYCMNFFSYLYHSLNNYHISLIVNK